MEVHKLYKDGSIDKFNDYFKALPIALAVSSLFFYAAFRFFAKVEVFAGHLTKEYPFLYLMLSILVGLISFVLMMIILMRPLFKISENKLTYYHGLFSKHTYRPNEIKSVQISSDKESITLDIRNIGGLSNTIEMRSVGYLGKNVEKFLKDFTDVKVIQLDE